MLLRTFAFSLICMAIFFEISQMHADQFHLSSGKKISPASDNRFHAKKLVVPKGSDKLTGVKDHIEDLNDIVDAINTHNLLEISRHVAKNHGSPGSQVAIEFEVKSGYVAHLRCNDRKKSGLSINFGKDGSVSMYSRFSAVTETGVIMHFSKEGLPTLMTSVKGFNLLGWQYRWSEKGDLIEKENVTKPRRRLVSGKGEE